MVLDSSIIYGRLYVRSWDISGHFFERPLAVRGLRG